MKVLLDKLRDPPLNERIYGAMPNGLRSRRKPPCNLPLAPMLAGLEVASWVHFALKFDNQRRTMSPFGNRFCGTSTRLDKAQGILRTLHILDESLWPGAIYPRLGQPI